MLKKVEKKENAATPPQTLPLYPNKYFSNVEFILTADLVVCACQVTSVVLTLCDAVDYSPPCSSVHGILQVRILERVAILPLGDLPDPGIQLASVKSPALAGRFFITSATWEAHRLVWNIVIAVESE